MATRIVTFEQLKGGTFIGGGNDTLALSGSQSDTFDLTQATISGFTTITTDDDFRIRMTSAQFSNITTINGTWYNFLYIDGPVVDIRGKSLSQVWGIDAANGVTVYANSLSNLDDFDCFGNKGETLKFFGILSEADRATAHRMGYDTVVDDTGNSTTNPPPVITNLAGERKLVRPGEIVLLDTLSDATAIDDEGVIRRIIVESKGYADSIRIVGTDRLTFVKNSSDGFDMYFDGVDIGNYSKNGGLGGNGYLFFHFDESAPVEAVDYVLHHIEFVRGASSRNDLAVTVTVSDRGGRQTSATVVMEGVDGPATDGGMGGFNIAPSFLTFLGGPISESAIPNSVIGTFQAIDPNGDKLFYSISDSYGGLFRVENNALVLSKPLDFEQRSSYTLQATASDGRGGSTHTFITINITDIIAEKTIGTSASEKILGNKGKDSLSGGGGDDTLGGGIDNDILTGGSDRDTFLFNTKPNKKSNYDRITDFNPTDDTISLENSVFTKLGKAGKLNKKAFFAGDKAHDASDRVIFNKKTGILYYDQDGSGSKAAWAIAKLDNARKIKLTYSDFMII